VQCNQSEESIGGEVKSIRRIKRGRSAIKQKNQKGRSAMQSIRRIIRGECNSNRSVGREEERQTNRRKQ